MSERLLIKLVIGRTVIDTDILNIPFQVEKGGRGWIISVSDLEASEATYIGDNINDLNFFHFIKDSSDSEDIRKFWLYDQDKPSFQFDPATREATFEVDSREAYSNDAV